MAKIAVTSADTNTFLNASRTVFRDSNGIPFVLSLDTTNDSIEMYVGSAATSPTFSVDDTVTGETLPVAVSGAIDSSDIIHVCWMTDEAKTSQLRYVTFTCSTGVFGTPVSVVADIGGDPVAKTNLYTAIAIDSNDVPHIAYNETPSLMGTLTYSGMYVNKVGGSWNTPVVVHEVQAEDCIYFNIAIDLDSIPQIVLRTGGVGSNVVSVFVGNLNNPTSFSSKQLAGSGLFRPSIAINSEGTTYVIFGGYNNYCYYHTYGAAWATWGNTGLSTAFRPVDVSFVAVGTAIYMFYEQASNSDIYYMIYDGTWSGATLLETGTFNSIRAKWGFWVDNDSGGALVLDLSAIPSNSAALKGGSGTDEKQGFKSGTSNLGVQAGNLSTIRQRVNVSGTPSDGLVLKAYSGSYEGTLIATSNTVVPITSGSSEADFTFDTPVPIGTANTYFVYERIGARDVSNFYYIYGKTDSLSGWDTNGKDSGSWGADDGYNPVIQLRILSAELDYAFVDETATPDVWWNTLSFGQNLILDAAPQQDFALTGYTAEFNITRVYSISASPQQDFALTGYAVTFSVPIIFDCSPQQDFSLTGYAATFKITRVYTLDASPQQDFSLTGFIATLTAHQSQALTLDAAPQQDFVLTGYPVTFVLQRNYTLDAAPQQDFTLTGYATEFVLQRNYTFDCSPQQDFALTGYDVTFVYLRQYILDAAPNQTFSLTGYDTTLSKTKILDAAPNQSFALTGYAVTFAIQRNYTLDASPNQTYTLEGFGVTFIALRNYTLDATPNQSFVLAGQLVTFQLQRHYTLDATPNQTFSLTGQVVAFSKHLILDASPQQDFSLTGYPAYFGNSFVLNASPQQDFSLTGYAVAFVVQRHYTLDASPQQDFALTGYNINLTAGGKLVADTGYFILTGYDVAFVITRVYTFSASPNQSFALTGYDVNLSAGGTLIAETGYFSLTGYDVTLTHDSGQQIIFDCSPQQDFALTGQNVTFIVQRNYTLEASPNQTFILSGQAVTFTKYLILRASPNQTFALTGYNVNLSAGAVLIAETGYFNVTGQNVTFRKALKLNAVPNQTFTIAGQNVTFRRALKLNALPNQSFALTGNITTFRKSLILDASPNQAFTETGYDVAFYVSAITMLAETGYLNLTGYPVSLVFYLVGELISGRSELTNLIVGVSELTPEGGGISEMTPETGGISELI